MEEKVKNLKKEKKLKQKEEKKRLKEEKKKNKRPVDKMQIAGRILAIVMIILMVFSVCGTLMFYLIQG